MSTSHDIKKMIQSSLWYLMLESCNYKHYKPVAELMCSISYDLVIAGEY